MLACPHYCLPAKDICAHAVGIMLRAVFVLCHAQVAHQEQELDQAYDAVEKELRATECKDSTLVSAQENFSLPLFFCVASAWDPMSSDILPAKQVKS